MNCPRILYHLIFGKCKLDPIKQIIVFTILKIMDLLIMFMQWLSIWLGTVKHPSLILALLLKENYVQVSYIWLRIILPKSECYEFRIFIILEGFSRIVSLLSVWVLMGQLVYLSSHWLELYNQRFKRNTVMANIFHVTCRIVAS